MKALIGVFATFFFLYLSAFLYMSFMATPNHEARFDMALDAFNEGNFSKAKLVSEPIAKKGDARAQHLMGHIFEFNANPNDDHLADEWFKMADLKGFVNDQLDHNDSAFATQKYFSVGLGAYNEGKFDKAMEALFPLAKDGNPEAQHLLGHIYAFNDDKNDDYEAEKWFRRAQELGFSNEKLAHNEAFGNMEK